MITLDEQTKHRELQTQHITFVSYFSEAKHFRHLLGLTLLGTLHYVQYYTFVMLSEDLKLFTMQQRNYLMLLARLTGRSSFLVVLLHASRRCLNFFISGSILAISSGMLVLSFLLEERLINVAGMAATSRRCNTLTRQSRFASSGAT